MKYAWHDQGEFVDRHFEFGAVVGDHLVAAVHGADRGGDDAATGVFEAFAGLQQGLLADHAEAADFLYLAVGVGDDPVAADQLRGDVAGIGDGDGIGENETILSDVGLFRVVFAVHLDFDPVLLAFGHVPIFHEFDGGDK